MRPEPLVSSFAKIEWAKAEINNINEGVNALFKNGAYTISATVDDKGVEVRRLAPPDIPLGLNVQVGNVLHNLRAPLDKTLSAIAVQGGHDHKGVQFPFGDTRSHFETALAKQKKLPADAHEIIRNARPYKTGNIVLWALHALNIPDNHHPELIPANLGVDIDFSEMILHSGELFSVGSRRGRHWYPDKFKNLVQVDPNKQPVAIIDSAMCRFGIGVNIVPTGYTVPIFYNQMGPGISDYLNEPAPDFSAAPNDDMEIFTCSPNAEINIKVDPTFTITFSNIDGIKRQPIVSVLHEAADHVEGLLLAFERRFFS